MQVQQKVPLGQHSTMRLGGWADYAVEVHSREEISEAVKWAHEEKVPMLMVGGGSNIVWRDEGFKGLLIINKVSGYSSSDKDGQNYFLTIGAGENWDSIVGHSVADGASGIEALSLVPGTAGATPVQNVGAYGQEISQTLVSIEAYDTKTDKFVVLQNNECDFGYRTSRYKTTDRGRFFILSITLHLSKQPMKPPFYPSLQKYLASHNIKDYSPQSIRGAVINIRQAKLPDPALIANNGSFFANPIIDKTQLTQLTGDHPELIHWPVGDKEKLSAAWLLEQAGFKDFHDSETGMATWPSQSLVFINEHAKSTADLLKFRDKIVMAVKAKFGITLEQEPELLP